MMTIIVFLIDTSASMNQRAYTGGRPTLLDVAKGAVETFVKVRQRCPESRGDRYMLLTFEDPPHNIKAGWKENLSTFMNELKNLQCHGMTTMGGALKHAFDVLNINRMQTGIDTYGQGRCPFFLEPSVIVVITDGGKLSTTTGVQEEFNLPMHSPIPGSELTREPFRWDQRLFSLVLRLSGTPSGDRDVGLVPSDTSPIDAMCEVTGGRSYSVTSHRMLMQCIDSLVQKVQSGVVISFEKIGPDPPPLPNEGTKEGLDNGDDDVKEIWDKDNSQNETKIPNGARHIPIPSNPLAPGNTSWHNCRRLIYVPRSAQKGFPVGFWPIPEAFWPDLQLATLPARTAHPNVKFSCTSQEPMVIDNLPFDKYELEPSPLTQYILARKQPTVCWQVFVSNSYKNSDVGHPFGYLKASTTLNCVNLFVMPYNYPVLLPLLDDLFKVLRQKLTPEWRTAFSNYLRTMPSYYAGPLRRALTRMGATGVVAQNLVPDTLDNCLSYTVLSYLKRLKNQAKMEFEKLCNDTSNKQIVKSQPEGIRVTPKSSFKRDLLSHPSLQNKFQCLKDQINEFNSFIVGIGHRKHRAAQSYRNSFDIQRSNLFDQIRRMRANFLNPSPSHTRLHDEDVLHSMPISQMGNYQEYLKKTQPSLREVESAPVRQHMFGNPFKIDKRMIVDEAELDLNNTGTSGKGHKRLLDGGPARPNKRKPGPIPRDFSVSRPSSPVFSSPPPSPSPPPPIQPVLIPSPPSTPPPVAPVMPPSPPPLINGDIGLEIVEEKVNNVRSPSPPADFSPPPVLQPYDGGPPSGGGGACPPPQLLPSYSTPPLSPPPLTIAEVKPDLPPPPPSKQELAMIRSHNLQIRALAYKEVRRPGRNYEPLFDHLTKMKGSVDLRIGIIKDVINESLRFKRKTLASHLDKQLKALINSSSNHHGNNGSR